MKKLKNENVFNRFFNRSPVFRGKQILLILLIFSGLLVTNGFALPVPNKGFPQAQILVSGTVTDVNGIALPSVTVQEKGTNNGVLTDFDGNFTIEVSSTESILEFSYVGMKSLSKIVGGNTSMNVQMEEDSQSLDEVIVVGYGTQKKSDVTGAISSISGADLNVTKESNPLNALAGKVAGVDIGIGNNSPGSSPSILVRGRSSLNFSNEPLIVLDGIPLEGDLTDINPADIASIEVLKDASSAAIYGARGANGVILITTKRGTTGKPRFTYDTYYGYSKPIENYDLMNSNQWVAFRQEAIRAAKDQNEGVPIGTNPIPSIDDALEPLQLQAFQADVDTDFQDLAFQNGEQMNHQLGVSGGSEKLKYYLSFSYFKQEGVYKPADFERYTFKANLDFDLTQKLKIGISQQGSFAERGDINPIELILRNSPLTIPFKENGEPTTDPLADGLIWNPLNDFDSDNYIDKTSTYRYLANIFASYQIFDDLKYTLSVQPQFEMNRSNNFRGSQSSDRLGGLATASKDILINTSYTIENILNYKKDFNEDNTLDAIFLYSFQDINREFLTLGVRGLPAETQTFNNLSDGEIVDFRDSFLETEGWTSYMGRFNYAFKNKYLLTLTGRYDGSSKLSKGNKWGFFPSASFAWRMIEEDFLVEQDVISDLKLRLGYGTVGRNPISPFSTLGGVSRVEGSFGGNPAFGFVPNEIANPDLKWETTTTFDVGIDFGFAHNRFSGSIDYYTGNTTDLLLNRFLPTSSGFESILQNVGETKTSGLELVLSTVNIESDNFRWTTDFNFSVNNNEIVELTDGKNDDIGNQWFIGKPLSVFYDRVFDGIWQLDEASEAASFGRNPGDIKLVDLNNDGIINDDDRRIIGQLDPKWTGGFTSRMDYKGFDFTVGLYTRQGHITTSTALETANTLFGRYNNLDVNYWTPENPSNEFPRPNANQERPLDSGVLNYIDASFVRVRNITFGYDFEREIIEPLRLESFRLYATAQNPFLFASEDLDGIDPEISGGNYYTPSPRTFLFGINVSF